MYLKINLLNVVVCLVFSNCSVVKRSAHTSSTTEFASLVTNGDSFLKLINRLSNRYNVGQLGMIGVNGDKRSESKPSHIVTTEGVRSKNADGTYLQTAETVADNVKTQEHLEDPRKLVVAKKENDENISVEVSKSTESSKIKHQEGHQPKDYGHSKKVHPTAEGSSHKSESNSGGHLGQSGSQQQRSEKADSGRHDLKAESHAHQKNEHKSSVVGHGKVHKAAADQSTANDKAKNHGHHKHSSEKDHVGVVHRQTEAEKTAEDLKKEEEVVSSAEELEVTANRVQKVLNAFHEVTGVLAEVPKQIWMLPLRFGLIPGIKRTQDIIPNLVPFLCHNVSEKYEPATSVHRLRPQDIKVVASLGDSITAANGAMAYSEEETRLNYRGISAMGGGQGNWRKFLTLPNILKEFSPKLQGYALGAPEPSSPLAGYNLAENGALDDALLKQARDLVTRIRHDPFINFHQDWKVVNILIGGNDVCNEFCYVAGEKDSPNGHRRMLEVTLSYLKAKLPRTFVNLIHIPNILQLRNLKNVPFICYAKQLVLCSCLFGGIEKSKSQAVERILQGYWEVERNISAMNKFDSDEFTVVLQPFFLGVESPNNLNTVFGEAPDLNLFAPDCFHFSQRSHALIANALWNNMWEPVGNKTRGWQPIMKRFLCPTPEAPYFFTRRNSEAFLEQGRQ